MVAEEQLTRAELEPLWEEDCRQLVPDFEIFNVLRMEREIERVRQACGMTPRDSDLAVIVHVLRSLEEGYTSVPAAWWWISAALLILPTYVDHPWLEVLFWVHEDMRGKREVTTVWGSASSSKSRFFVAMILTNMVVWHGGFHAYITCPFKNTADDKIMLAITEHTLLWEAEPPEWAVELGLKIANVQGQVTMTDRDFKISMCKLVSLETTASVQGKKRVRFDFENGFDPRTGGIMLVGDEIVINAAICHEYWEAAGNLVSNNNFQGWVGMNPLPHQVKHANSMRLSAPVDRSIESLNEHSDFTWLTARGRLIRLCMANSPNRFMRRPVFDFLINEEQAAASARGGDHSVAAQVAAWGWSGGLSNGGVLTLDAVNSPAVQNAPVWSVRPGRWGFFDLAFGGRDPAGYCAFEGGTGLFGAEYRTVVSVVEQEKIHVSRRWTPSHEDVEEFKRLATARGGKAPDIAPGVEIEANAHMVLQMLRAAARLGLPRGAVSFDSSMRTDVTIMARDALGTVPWYYDGTRALKDDEGLWPLYPPVLKTDGTAKKWSDEHQRVISAAWRFAEHVIVRGHVHNLARVKTATHEMLSRPWVRSSTKEDLAGKQTLPVSPMYAETLCLGLAFGVRFCGALPQLANEKPLSIGGGAVFESHSIFKLGSRKLAPIWR